MKIKLKELRKIIYESIINEVNIEDIGETCFSPGSTHLMKTCSLGGNKYYLKFSDADLFENVDPSLQILVEYLAYTVYSLYKGIKIPKFELVYDKKNSNVGIATSEIPGKLAGTTHFNPKKLAIMLSSGVYVDVLLSNWDVIGTGTGNIFIDDKEETATRIDPGGSLTFRAQGGRKGNKFGKTPGELKTMLDPNFGGSGMIYQYADLKEAAMIFTSVSWNEIETALNKISTEISKELYDHGMKKLFAEWQVESQEIIDILRDRHQEILKHINYVMS